MQTVKIWDDAPSAKALDEITTVLEDGGIIIYPTDTVYAYACDALNVSAVSRLCKIKGINPEKNNLSIVCDNISNAAEYARIDNAAFKLLKEYTPGPYTFLFKALSTLPKAFKGRKIVGVRIPDCFTSRSIVKRLGRPLLTTSIDLSDEDYAIEPSLIIEKYGHGCNLLVDGGQGRTELSTIVDCTGSSPQIIRQGKGEIDL